jgi:hypothetical protein
MSTFNPVNLSVQICDPVLTVSPTDYHGVADYLIGEQQNLKLVVKPASHFSVSSSNMTSLQHQQSFVSMTCSTKAELWKLLLSEVASPLLRTDCHCMALIEDYIGKVQMEALQIAKHRVDQLPQSLRQWIDLKHTHEMENFSANFRVAKSEMGQSVLKYDFTFIEPDSDFNKLLIRLLPFIPAVGATHHLGVFVPLLMNLGKITEQDITLEQILDCARSLELTEEDIGFLEVFIRAIAFPEFVDLQTIIRILSI